MSEKIQSLETKLSSMNDKMDAQKFHHALQTHSNRGKLTEVAEIPSDNAGAFAEDPAPIPHDPEAGFTQDAAVQNFRKALIIFQGLKYPEATLAFSDFLEKYPDHAMAGAAQFYIAEAYTKQNEPKLALQEYQKLLTTYDRSSHVADTLKQMAAAEDILKRREEAARHRQLLTSLFPLSPAASELEIISKSENGADAKSEVKSEAKSETKSEAKFEAKPETKSETKFDTKFEDKYKDQLQPNTEHKPLDKFEGESQGKLQENAQDYPRGRLEDKAQGKFEDYPQDRFADKYGTEIKQTALGHSARTTPLDSEPRTIRNIPPTAPLEDESDKSLFETQHEKKSEVEKSSTK